MRLHTVQIVAGLLAALAFILAFLAAGAGLISGLFMLAGFAALAWLTWNTIRRVLRRGREGRLTPSA